MYIYMIYIYMYMCICFLNCKVYMSTSISSNTQNKQTSAVFTADFILNNKVLLFKSFATCLHGYLLNFHRFQH